MALSISPTVVGTGVSACRARPAAAEALGRARPAGLGLPLQSVRWRFGSGFGVGSVLASLPASVSVAGFGVSVLQSSACRARRPAELGLPLQSVLASLPVSVGLKSLPVSVLDSSLSGSPSSVPKELTEGVTQVRPHVLPKCGPPDRPSPTPLATPLPAPPPSPLGPSSLPTYPPMWTRVPWPAGQSGHLSKHQRSQ